MKLVIDRTKWLRGEPNSYLLRVTDEKMCCLGFYSLACGLTREQIFEKATPADAALNQRSISGADFNLPDQMNWLFSRRDGTRGGHFNHSDAAHQLMVMNDDKVLTPDEREILIAQIFRMQGVEVEFIN